MMDHGLVTRDQISGIVRAHGLGPLLQVEPATHGAQPGSFLVNGHYFLRITTRDNGTSELQSEAIAYRMLARSGLPVPRVIVVDQTQQLGAFDYLIVSRLPGLRVAGSHQELSPAQGQALAREAGRALAQIHQVPLEGFGRLRDIHASPCTTWASYFNGYANRLLKPARDTGLLGLSVLSRLESSLDRSQAMLKRVTQSRLLHGSYSYTNILHADGYLTGIVDFKSAMAGDPCYDFLDTRQRETILPSSEMAFLEGYRSLGRLDEEHAQRLRLYSQFQSLENALACRRRGDFGGVRAAVTQLNHQLN